MKKLLNLKQWLTVTDAARHLGLLFEEDVTEADVLQLALDEQLTLSVYFVNRATGRRGSVVPLKDAKRRVIKKNENEQFDLIEGMVIGQDSVIQWDPEIVVLEGIWDLTMLGAERLDVEHRYQTLTGGLTLIWFFWMARLSPAMTELTAKFGSISLNTVSSSPRISKSPSTIRAITSLRRAFRTIVFWSSKLPRFMILNCDYLNQTSRSKGRLGGASVILFWS